MKKRAFALLAALVLLLAPSLAMAREYIIADSDTRQLTEMELWGWDYESLGYILNEIFARHGYVFNVGGEYEAYFTRLSWYKANANSDNSSVVYPQLSTVEWYNERLVKDVRANMRDQKNYNTGAKNYLDYITFGSSSGSGSSSLSSGTSSISLYFTSKSFKANQKFDVYSAPTSYSYRGASGKACVSTNGPVYVAGWENNWLMLMYDTNSGAVRVGYVRKSDISGSVSASTLSFAYTSKTVSRTVTLTDDPVTGSTDIVQLSSGKTVTYLASYNNGTNWAYVETTVSGKTVRGFIPANALK